MLRSPPGTAKVAKIFQHLSSIDALADNDRARNINPVHLEYRLRNIKPNRANLAQGRLPSMWFASTQPPYGTSMPKSGRRPQHQKRTWLERLLLAQKRTFGIGRCQLSVDSDVGSSVENSLQRTGRS